MKGEDALRHEWDVLDSLHGRPVERVELLHGLAGLLVLDQAAVARNREWGMPRPGSHRRKRPASRQQRPQRRTGGAA